MRALGENIIQHRSVELSVIKEILEYIYLLSSPAIVFVAYKALGQIKITREIARTNSKREAFKVTAQECRYFSEKIIPLIDALDEKIENLDIQFFTKSEVKIENNSIQVKPFVKYKHHNDTFDEISLNLVSLMNSLSDFSMFFISGVADERLAYNSVSTTYCGTIEKLAPILVPAAGDDAESTLRLYMIWHNRKEKEEAIKEKKKLDKKIKENSSVTIKPIGT